MLSQSLFILNSLIAQIPQGGQASQIAADGAASSQAIAEAMNLKKGYRVCAVIKSTEVMIQKD